jgi:hypothetical protein
MGGSSGRASRFYGIAAARVTVGMVPQPRSGRAIDRSGPLLPSTMVM